MSQNLTTFPIRQMPHVTSPDLFDIKAPRKLTANRLNQPSNPLAKMQLLDIKLSRPGHNLYSLSALRHPDYYARSSYSLSCTIHYIFRSYAFMTCALVMLMQVPRMSCLW